MLCRLHLDLYVHSHFRMFVHLFSVVIFSDTEQCRQDFVLPMCGVSLIVELYIQKIGENLIQGLLKLTIDRFMLITWNSHNSF